MGHSGNPDNGKHPLPSDDAQDLLRHLLQAVDALERYTSRTPRTAQLRKMWKDYASVRPNFPDDADT